MYNYPTSILRYFVYFIRYASSAAAQKKTDETKASSGQTKVILSCLRSYYLHLHYGVIWVLTVWLVIHKWFLCPHHEMAGVYTHIVLPFSVYLSFNHSVIIQFLSNCSLSLLNMHMFNVKFGIWYPGWVLE